MPAPRSGVPNLLPSQACLTLAGLAHCNLESIAWNGISSIWPMYDQLPSRASVYRYTITLLQHECLTSFNCCREGYYV